MYFERDESTKTERPLEGLALKFNVTNIGRNFAKDVLVKVATYRETERTYGIIRRRFRRQAAYSSTNLYNMAGGETRHIESKHHFSGYHSEQTEDLRGKMQVEFEIKITVRYRDSMGTRRTSLRHFDCHLTDRVTPVEAVAR